MPDKDILCYIYGWSHVYILVGGLVPGSSGGAWLVDIVVLPVRLQTPSTPSVLSPIGDHMISPMVGYKHQPLYLSGSGRASQEAAISGSCQQALLGFQNSVWDWRQYTKGIHRWESLWMAFPSVSAPHFVSPPIAVLFPFLRRNEVSILWSSFFLSFMWSINDT